MKSRDGFTLVEVLIVIAIIGMLSSIVMANIDNARSKARDTKRKQDMSAIQTALEIYYVDNNSYPSTSMLWRGQCTGAGNFGLSGPNGYVPNLAPTYIPSLPTDPDTDIRGCGIQSCYYYMSNGTDYVLLAHCTPENYPVSGSRFYDPFRPTWAYKLCSGEPACSW